MGTAEQAKSWARSVITRLIYKHTTVLISLMTALLRPTDLLLRVHTRCGCLHEMGDPPGNGQRVQFD
jgi:hypothetical protein